MVADVWANGAPAKGGGNARGCAGVNASFSALLHLFSLLPFSPEAHAPSCDGDVEHCALTVEFSARGLSGGAPAGGGQEMEMDPQP